MIDRHSKLWWAIGALACAVLLVALAFHSLLDREHLKTLATERVKAIWSRALGIGDVSLQLVPFPALQAMKISLSNPQWARQRYLLEADRLTAKLDLLPLLSGQIVVSAISIDGMKLHLESASDGNKSWQLQRTDGAGGKQSRGEATFDPKLLTAIELRNARIDYDNGENARTWLLDRLSLRARPGWRDAHLDANISHNEHDMHVIADVADLSGIGNKGAVSEGVLEAQWKQARLALRGLLPLEPSLQNQMIRADFAAQLNSERLDWAQFTHDLGRPTPRPGPPGGGGRAEPGPGRGRAAAAGIE